MNIQDILDALPYGRVLHDYLAGQPALPPGA
jgi:hypothetical protein